MLWRCWSTLQLLVLVGCGPGGVQQSAKSVSPVRRGAQRATSGWVTAIQFIPGSGKLAFGTKDGRILLCTTTKDERVELLGRHSDRVECLAVTQDGNVLGSGGGIRHRGTIVLWDLSANKEKKRLEAQQGYVLSLSFSRDEQLLACGTEEGVVTIWKYPTLELVHSLESGRTEIYSLEFAPDSRTLVSGTLQGTVSFWQASSWVQVRTFQAHKQPLRVLRFRPDGTKLATGSMDGTIRLWDSSTLELQQILETRGGAVRSLEFSADGAFIAATAGREIYLWDITRGERRILESQTGEVGCAVVAPDGVLLASGHDNGVIQLWDLTTGTLRKTISVPPPP